jgi:predicted dehydrogenase
VSAPRRGCVLGQGSIGRRHAGLLRDAGLDVVTFDPLNPSCAGSETEALEAAEVCVVASPSSEHARQARIAIAAGVPVLVEKPLALDATTARSLEEAATAAGVPLGVAMNLRFHPGVQAVRGAAGEIGVVWRADAFCGSWLPGWRPGTDYRRSYSAQRALGGGVLLDAIHEIDYLTWILGAPTAVRATVATVSDLELDVEDTALLTLEFGDGALATITLDYLDRAYHRGARLVGASGTIEWDWARELVVVHTDGAEPKQIVAPADAAPTYAAELRAFLDAVAAGDPPPVDAAAGRRALEVVDAARRSAADGGRRTAL